MPFRERRGFTLIELMIVVTIIAVLAAIAIPGYLRARILSNETATLGSLRSLVTAQAQFKQANIIDQDSNAEGEYGYLQELTTVSPLPGGATLNRPAFVTTVFGTTAQGAGGYAGKSGYTFLVWLPTAAAAQSEADVDPLPRAVDAAAAGYQAQRWIIYAWPQAYANSGLRAYVANQTGQVHFSRNDSTQYSGTATVPVASAALDTGGTDPANLNAQIATSAATSGDGEAWLTVGGG